MKKKFKNEVVKIIHFKSDTYKCLHTQYILFYPYSYKEVMQIW